MKVIVTAWPVVQWGHWVSGPMAVVEKTMLMLLGSVQVLDTSVTAWLMHTWVPQESCQLPAARQVSVTWVPKYGSRALCQ